MATSAAKLATQRLMAAALRWVVVLHAGQRSKARRSIGARQAEFRVTDITSEGVEHAQQRGWVRDKD